MVHFYGSAFFGGEFFFSAQITIDTHDGFDGKRRNRKQKEDKERLHRQIEDAFNAAFARKSVPEINTVAKPVAKKFIDDDEDWLLLL